MRSLEVARRANGVFLSRLLEQVEDLAGQSFPGLLPGPDRFLSVVKGLIDTGFEYLSQSDKTSDQNEANRLVVDAALLGQHAVNYLAHFKGAEASEIPFQVVRPLQRWFDELDVKHTLFFRAEHAPNYELARFPKNLFSVRNASASLQSALANADWPIHRVTVPSRSLGILPYFSVVAHEAGHAIFDRIVPELNKHISPGPLNNVLSTLVSQKGSPLSIEENKFIANVRNKWIEELVADAVAHNIVGPAFYFSLFGFLEMTNPGYGIADTHPPSYLRRSLLHAKLCASGGYAHLFQKNTGVELVLDINSPGLKVPADLDVLQADLVKIGYKYFFASAMRHLVAYLEAIYDEIFQVTLDVMKHEFPTIMYSPESYDDDLNQHLEPLCYLIPPIEYVKDSKHYPTSLSTILNVGWAAQLTRLDQIQVSSGRFGHIQEWRMERIHSLLLKAVELSEARHVWDGVK